MISVIIPVTDKFSEYEKTVNDILKTKDVKVYLGVDEKYKDACKFDNKNVVIKFYKGKSKKEEIINSLHAIKKEKSGIMVIRRPLTEGEFEKMLKSSADIVTLRKQRNKFAEWWFSTWLKIIKRMFSFVYFEDISAIYFKENMFDLIESLTNLSYITRINRFVGLTEEDISTTTKATKKDYDRFSNVAQFISSILFFALCIVLSIILCTSVAVTVLSVLGGVAICLIGIVVFMISTLNFARTIYIGTLRYGKAEELV